MGKTVKFWFCIVSGFLAVVAVIMFAIAILKGCQHQEVDRHPIHVYINNNDSIVNKLQMDVERLTKMIERMDSDSVVVEIRHINKK